MEIVIQFPYFTLIIVLSCEKLHSSARDFLWLEHLFKANVSTSIPVLYIKTKSTEMTVIVTISFLPIRTSFLPSQQRVIGLSRKYFAPHLFCCHGVISAWYFKAILITFWQVGVNAVWMLSLQARFPFPFPSPSPFFSLFPTQMSLFAGYCQLYLLIIM